MTLEYHKIISLILKSIRNKNFDFNNYYIVKNHAQLVYYIAVSSISNTISYSKYSQFYKTSVIDNFICYRKLSFEAFHKYSISLFFLPTRYLLSINCCSNKFPEMKINFLTQIAFPFTFGKICINISLPTFSHEVTK